MTLVATIAMAPDPWAEAFKRRRGVTLQHVTRTNREETLEFARAWLAERQPVHPEPWPATPEDLIAIQQQLGLALPEPWRPEDPISVAAGCFVCFARGYHGPGAAGDAGWAAAALTVEGSLADIAVVRGEVAAPYEPGLLALREGPLLEAAARAMLEQARGATPSSPEVLLVDATGRDHPRRAGLALHLGARLSIATVGVTMRPLQAEGAWPDDVEGAVSPLRLDDQVVGYWLRTKRGARPLAIHAAWRTGPEDAVAIVRALMGPWRTPEPLRQARRAAREARAKDVG